VSSTIVCGDAVDLTITVTPASGTLKIPASLRTGAPGVTQFTANSTDVPKSIPDGNQTGVTSNLAIASVGRISDLDVTIGSISHTWDADLAIDLISPAGTTVRLFNHHGGSGDNLTNTVFNDSAATAISAGAAPFTGSFRPFQPLSAFNGQATNGTWKLRVVDNASFDTGALNSWGTKRRIYTCT
jgi:subtilisin-like proprotein convertase family protein